MRVSAAAAAITLTAACSQTAQTSGGSQPASRDSVSESEPAPAEDATATGSKWPAATLAELKAKYGNLIETPSGLLYVITKQGDGATFPRRGQAVRTHYTGTFPDGRVFDSSVSRGQPFVFPAGVGRVIPAWDEAVLSMSKGEKRTIIVPPNLGYGSRGAGGVIPPDATLVFEMELLGVVDR
jgi:peptidylprolyl isomerase